MTKVASGIIMNTYRTFIIVVNESLFLLIEGIINVFSENMQNWSLLFHDETTRGIVTSELSILSLLSTCTSKEDSMERMSFNDPDVAIPV